MGLPGPPDDNAVIWRYMDYKKFEYFLTPYRGNTAYGQIWFGYPRAFETNYEGTMPLANMDPEEYCRKMAKNHNLSPEEAEEKRARFMSADTELIRKLSEELAKLCGVSCWSATEEPDPNMWQFLDGMNGVAVKTTVRRLERAVMDVPETPALSAKVFMSQVGYIDYSTDFSEYDDFRSLLCLGTNDDEYEVRFVAESPLFQGLRGKHSGKRPSKPSAEDQNECRRRILMELLPINEANKDQGFMFPVILEGLFDAVAVRTRQGKFYFDTVCEQLKAANFDPDIAFKR